MFQAFDHHDFHRTTSRLETKAKVLLMAVKMDRPSTEFHMRVMSNSAGRPVPSMMTRSRIIDRPSAVVPIVAAEAWGESLPSVAPAGLRAIGGCYAGAGSDLSHRLGGVGAILNLLPATLSECTGSSRSQGEGSPEALGEKRLQHPGLQLGQKQQPEREQPAMSTPLPMID
jgi:hypothetical protein